MKTKILISLVATLILSFKAQAHWGQMIGLTKADVIYRISSDNSQIFENLGTSTDGVNYLLYRDKERFYFEYIYYFDSSGICIADGFILTKVNYTGLVTQFNHDYKLVSDDVWEDDIKKLKIAIRPIPNTDKILIEFSKL